MGSILVKKRPVFAQFRKKQYNDPWHFHSSPANSSSIINSTPNSAGLESSRLKPQVRGPHRDFQIYLHACCTWYWSKSSWICVRRFQCECSTTGPCSYLKLWLYILLFCTFLGIWKLLKALRREVSRVCCLKECPLASVRVKRCNLLDPAVRFPLWTMNGWNDDVLSSLGPGTIYNNKPLVSGNWIMLITQNYESLSNSAVRAGAKWTRGGMNDYE
jgi:hypothetical protein